MKITRTIAVNILNDYNNKLTKRQIAMKYNVSKSTIIISLRKMGVNPIRKDSGGKYFRNEKFFEAINTEEKAYFLGLLMADGCIVKRDGKLVGITMAQKDGDIVEKFKTAMETNAPIHIYKIPNYLDNHVLNICSPKLATDAEKLDLVHNKTYRTRISEKIPKDLVRHFIRGYFDGDGCLYIRKNKRAYTFMFTSCSKLVLEQIQENFKLNKLIRNDNFIEKYRKYNCYDLRFDNTIEIYRILRYLYKDATVYMDRKFELYKDFMSRMRPRKAHNSTTKYYGVMFHKTRTKNQYAGVLGYQGKVYNLGCFQTEIEAAKAYNIKVKELNLPEYMLNKIEEPTSLTQ